MIETTILLNLTEGHRKYYIIELHKEGQDFWTVTGYWGRVGVMSQSKIYLHHCPNEWIARQQVKRLYNTRLDHGYTLHERNNKPAPSSVSTVEAILSAL